MSAAASAYREADGLFLVGRGIAHSLSPALHQAAFEALGLPWTYALFDAPAPEDARAFIESRAYRAINVTTPYKALALELADQAEPAHAAGQPDLVRFSAQGLPGANVLIPTERGLEAYNTDGEGARAYLEREGIQLAGARVLVCGTGPTACAIARAMCGAHAADATLLSRSRQELGIARYGDAADLFHAADLIINATPVGMRADDVLPFPTSWLSDSHIVLDAVYGHGETPFSQAALKRGCRFFDGEGMLVAQAAFTLLLVLARTGAPCRVSFDEAFQMMMPALRNRARARHALQ